MSALSKAESSFDVTKITSAMIALMKDDPSLTLADMEREFRQMGSHTYLVAMHGGAPVSDMEIRTLEGRIAKHWVYICLYGEVEAEGLLEAWGRTPEENLTDLRECGFLVVKERK